LPECILLNPSENLIKEIVFERSIPVNGKLNSKVLVLNNSYEPLSICSIRKAFILLYLGKAEPVVNDERKNLHSVSREYPWPSVIRINRFIKLPYKKVILTRKNILRRDSFKCSYCGRSDIPLTVDHVFPKARGGDDTWENLITACTVCNNRKGDRTPEEANMKLLSRPFKPSHILFIKNVVSRLDERWKPYLYLS
jgi:5-methylcytosine-specific restriction endonuclease McrA